PGAAPVGPPSEYTEVPLGCLQIPGGGALSPQPTGPPEAERFEELPLCSCRMEAPKVERGGGRTGALHGHRERGRTAEWLWQCHLEAGDDAQPPDFRALSPQFQ
ncbi:histone-lysine N-methyltransferase EHMT2-like, partial [Neopelma chrysocephalum]|uniref:histone-lysine N-methyltransferase EHMT2-like n=1 Tax=Neopelma chrysocephalum TaxID=114329 RepID=UPI000FCD113F